MDINAMITSENWMIRGQLASNRDLSLDQIEALLTDSHETVRQITSNVQRDIPTELILRVLQKFPEDAANFAYTNTAPGISLGFKPLNWVSKADLGRYLDFKRATARQRDRMVDARAKSQGAMETLDQLWDRESDEGHEITG